MGSKINGGVVLLLWLAVWLPRLEGPIDLRWDASTYYVLGTSLAEGKGYRLLNEPGQIEAVQYPPLVPLIVAATQRAMGTSDYFEVGSRLRLLYFVLSGVYLLAAYALACAILSPPYALLVVAITSLSFSSFLYPSDSLYTEIPFALVSVLFLLCHRRAERPAYAVAAGILGVISYFIRTAGVALLAAWVGESLLRRRFGQAAVRAAVAALPVVLWQGYITKVMDSPAFQQTAYPYQRAPYYYSNVTYGENSRLVDPFRPELGRTAARDVVGRVFRNLQAIPGALGESAWMDSNSGPYLLDKLHRELGLPLPDDWRNLSKRAVSWCLLGLGGLALLGAFLLSRPGERFIPFYFAITIAMIVLTPWQSQFWRYLAPITPLTLIFLIHALQRLGRWLSRRESALGSLAGSFVITVPLAGMLLAQVVIASGFLRTLLPVSYYDATGRKQALRLLTYEPVWHDLDPALEWVRRNAGPHAIVATSVPHLAYLRTGRQAVLPPMEPDPSVASRLLESVPVSYLVLDRLGRPGISERYAAPIVARFPEQWKLTYTTPGGGANVYARTR
jgi:hypothetical protein